MKEEKFLSRKHILFLAQAAMIAAAYAVLTNLVPGINSGVVQFRFSEALCILAVFTPAAVPGLTVGCVVANLIAGNVIWDVVFGSLATLIGAVGVRMLRRIPWIAALPYALSNIIIIPFVLKWAYGVPDSFGFLFLSLGISEMIAAYGLGTLLWFLFRPVAGKAFKSVREEAGGEMTEE